MLIATYPHDQDITVCFDEEQHLTSMLIEPNNTSYWLPNEEEKKNMNCLTLSGHVELIQPSEN